jgi:GxxExxY protein
VELDPLTDRIIGAAVTVHRELGPGLLESTYEACMAHLLVAEGLLVERQKAVPLTFRNVKLDCGYRLDLLVERQVVVEVKAVDALNPIFTAQVLTYMKLARCRHGLILNFNLPLLKEGIRRLILDVPPL